MQTSARGICKPKGFTLLELLIVVVVLSIATAFIVVRGAPSDKNHLEAEAKKLTQLLRIAQQHAKLTATSLRMVTQNEGYRFEAFSNNHWSTVETEPLLRPRTWEHGPLRVTLQQAGQTVPALLLESQPSLIEQTVTLQKNQTTVQIQRLNGGPFETHLDSQNK